MAEDIADIGFRAETKDLDKANRKLKELPGNAKKTEKATDRLKRSFGGLATRAGASAKAMDAMTGSARRLGRAIAVMLGTLAAGLSLRKFIIGTTEADRVQSQLAASIKSTGGAANQSLQSLNAHAAALQKVTKFGDETINAAQGILLSFTKIQGDTFPKATTAVLNVATALQTDLKSAAIQVGKALNDPVLGMTALSRSGITFSETQKKLVKDMVAVGNVVGAQTLILKELEIQFGGSAMAARENLGGALSALKNAFGDLFELTGPGVESLRLAIEALIAAISTQRFAAFITMIGDTLFAALELGVKGATFLATHIDTLQGIVVAFGTYVAGTLVASMLAGATGVGVLSGAVSVLGAVLLRLPFVAIIVSIGYLIGKLIEASDKVGGFGKLIGLMVNVAVEEFARIGAAVGLLVVKFQIVQNKISTSWGAWITGLSADFGRLVDGIAGTALGQFVGLEGGNEMAALAKGSAAIVSAETAMTGLMEKEAALSAQLNAPNSAMKTLRDQLSGKFGTTTGTGLTVNDSLLPPGAVTTPGGGTGGGTGGGGGGGVDQAIKDMEKLAAATKKAAQESANFTKGVVKGAIDDVRNAMKDGKVTVEEWRDVFLGALDKITDRMLNQVLDAVFQVNDAVSAGGGAGGGGIGGIIGNVIGSLFNAKGNAFENGSRVNKFASGGVVSSTTSFGMSGGQTGIMGEAGPEGILPLTRTRGGDLGVKQVGGGDGGVVVQIVDQRGADAPPVRQERSQTGDGRELRRFIIGAVKEATASGELDNVQGGRFGARPVKVLR